MIIMPMPTPSSLLRDLDQTAHAERCRRVVAIAMDHRQDPHLAELLDSLAAESDYHHVLALRAARAIGDVHRLRRATLHPSVRVRRAAVRQLPLPEGDEEFADLYAASSGVDRAVLRGRLLGEHRTDLADALIGRDLGDDQRAGLLSAASLDTVRALLPDLADLVPNLRALAVRHPDLVLDHLEARITGALRIVRRHWWDWVGPALPDLIVHDADRMLTLLESYGPDVWLPRGATTVIRFLVRHDPHRIADLLCDQYAASRLPAGIIVEFRLFSPADRIRLAARVQSNSRQLAALLDALPPSERGAVYEALFSEAPPKDTAALVNTLPRDVRHDLGRHLLTLPQAKQPAVLLAAAAALPYEEAREVVAPFVTSSVAEERAAAQQCLLRAAGHDRNPEAWADAVTGLDRLANEQDPVRLAAASTLTELPIAGLATGPLAEIGRFVDNLVAARDTSRGALSALQAHCWRAVRWSAEHARTDLVTAHFNLLDRLAGPQGSLHVPDLTTLPHGAEQLIIDALLPRIRTAVRRNDHRLLLALAGGLGTRLRSQAQLQALLEEAVHGSDDTTIRRAIRLWLSDPATRGVRVAQVLKRDKSTITLHEVQSVVLTVRQDLLDKCWSRRSPWGRFWRSRTRYVPLLDGSFGRMLPRQGQEYAQALIGLAEQRSTPTGQVTEAIGILSRLPGVGLDALTPFLASGQIPLVEAALGALPRTADPRAVDLLLAHRGDDRARVAAYAMGGAVRHLRPADVTQRLLTLAGPGSKVTAAKEGVRLLGIVRPPGALDALLTAVAPDSHRDIRAAQGRTLRAFLDDDRAWGVLEAQARGTRSEALAINETSPTDLPVRHRARYAAVVQSAVTTWPELLNTAGPWAVWQPALVGPLIAQVADSSSGWWRGCIKALAEAVAHGAAWAPTLALAEDLAIRALAADQPDAEADRDLPLLQRLTRLCTKLLGRNDDALRPRWTELAEVLARHQSSQRLALSAAVAAIAPRDPAPGTLRLLELAPDPLAADALASLIGDASQLRNAPAVHLAEAVDAASGDSPVAGRVALALVELAGAQASWSGPWRERLRTLRRHPEPSVAEAARQVLTAPER